MAALRHTILTSAAISSVILSLLYRKARCTGRRQIHVKLHAGVCTALDEGLKIYSDKGILTRLLWCLILLRITCRAKETAKGRLVGWAVCKYSSNHIAGFH